MPTLAARAHRASPAALRSLLVALLGSTLLASCHRPHWKHRVDYAEAGFGVFTEAFFDDEAKRVPQGFAHPIEISETDLAILLAKLGYVRSRVLMDSVTGHLLAPDQIEALTPPLAEALKKLGPDERVRFLACDTSAFMGLFRNVKGTSAVIFSPQPDRIDIAFDMIDDEVMTGDSGNLRSVRFYTQPTEIRDSSIEIVPPDGAFHHVDPKTGQPYPLWVTVERSQIGAIVERTLAEAKEARKPPPPTTGTPTPTAGATKSPDGVSTTPAGPPPVGPVAVSDPNGPKETPGGVEKLAFELEGCQVYKHGDVYYALPPGEGELDLEKVEKKDYDLLFKGNNLADIKEAIEEAKAGGLLD